jgi:phage major head subunit gpT-like protein
MAIARGTLPDVFLDYAATLFFNEVDEQPSLYSQVFNIESSSKAYEDWFEVSGLGQFRLKPEGTPISYDDPTQGPRRRAVNQSYALGSRITYEAIEDKQYDVITQIPKDLGPSGREAQEILAWSMLNLGFVTTTYTTIDGLALFSASHTMLKPKDPVVATQSNIANPGVALSTTGLEDMMTTMRLTKSTTDRYTPLSPATLVVHPSKAHLAYQLLVTEKEPFTNENQSSTTVTSRTGMKALDVPWLTATNAWFALAQKRNHRLTYFNRQDLTFDTGMDMQTKDTLMDAMFRATVAQKHWFGTYGSNP